MDRFNRAVIVLSLAFLALVALLYGCKLRFDAEMDKMYGSWDDDIEVMINEQKKIATYQVYDKRVDVVELNEKKYGEPYTVKNTLLKDIILYYYPEDSSEAYFIVRDGTHWHLDNNGHISEYPDKSYKNINEFEDMYYEHSQEPWQNPPIYPTCFFKKDGLKFRATYNRYTENYYLEFCEIEYDEEDSYVALVKGAKSFKVEYPYVYVIHENGKTLVNMKGGFYINEDIPTVDFEGCNKIPQEYLERFNDLDNFTDISKLKYKAMKVTDNANWWQFDDLESGMQYENGL